jgi:lipoate-protein ligase A
MRWRILVTPPLDGVDNMALDHALLDRARSAGEAVLRVYGWRRPTLSLGRNQPARGLYDLPAAGRLGVAVLRRPTGGRALLHHREVTYSVTAPAAGRAVRESYARINRLLLDGLRRLGVDAALAAPAGAARPPSVAPCFEAPTAGEVVVGGRKLVGSAQWRDGDALLQHGSILIDDDQPLVAALTQAPVPPPPPPATLRALLGRAPSLVEVADALRASVAEREDPAVGELPADDGLAAAARAYAARYADDDWTWRR